MKRIFYQYGWIPMILAFILMLFVAYKIVDNPEEVGARETPYSIPDFVVGAAEQYGEEYNISPELLIAIAWVESRYNPKVSNKSGTCHGLMQISYSAHGSRMAKLGVTDIFEPYGNMKVAADYLQELFEEYEDLPVVLAIYNGQSQSRVNAAMYDGYISSYAQEIIDLAYELEELRGKHVITCFDPDTADWENAVG